MIRIVGICFVLAACQIPGTEQVYPSRPLSFIVPWEAESTAGTASQILAVALGNELDQPVDIIYQPGFDGFYALEKSEADGYTVGVIGTDVTIKHWTGVTLTDFDGYDPIALIAVSPAAITVHADAPWNTVNDLVSAMKAAPGSITASGTHHGGIRDLERIGFLTSIDLEPTTLLWQPSQDGRSAVQQLLEGNVDMVLTSVSDVDSLRKEGHVRTLAVMATKRISLAPDVPTLNELGIAYESPGSWIMLTAPLKLPNARLELLRVATGNLLRQSAFRRSLASTGFQLQHITGLPLNIFLQEEDARNGMLIKKAGLSLEKR